MSKNKFFALVCIAIILIIFSSCKNSKNSNSSTTNNVDSILNVVSYSSFADDWGAGKKIIEIFEKDTGIKVNLIDAGAGAELVSYVENNYNKKNIDVVVGISDDFVNGNIKKYVDDIEEFDYSYYAFLKAKNSNIRPPRSLDDLLRKEYNKQFILIDPRTSAVGLGLLYWTYSVFGEEESNEWWKLAEENALTVASSWTEAYGLFTNGEAPIVLSYYTSPWYDMYNGDEPYAETLEFEDGHIKCSEYMGIVKNTERKSNAKKFIEYMLNDSSQELLSSINVMYPKVNPERVLIKEPTNVVKKTSIGSEAIIDSWTKEVL